MNMKRDRTCLEQKLLGSQKIASYLKLTVLRNVTTDRDMVDIMGELYLRTSMANIESSFLPALTKEGKVENHFLPALTRESKSERGMTTTEENEMLDAAKEMALN